MLEFIEKKFCVMGLHQPVQSYQHEYKDIRWNPRRSDNICQFLLTLLANNKWCSSLRNVMEKLMNSFISVSETYPNILTRYCAFCKLLFKNIKNGVNHDDEQCAADVAHALSIAIGIKYGLLQDDNSGTNKSFRGLKASEILLILKHLVLNETDFNLQKHLLLKFVESYSVDTTLSKLQSSKSSKNNNGDENSILSNSYIQDLFKKRLKYLKHIIEPGKPEFTWKISKLTTDSELNAFLIGEIRTYQTQRGKFSTIQLAKDWIEKHKKQFDGYLRFKATGSGNKSFVKVTKTQKHFHEMMQQYEKHVRQHSVLTTLIVSSTK